MRSTTITIASTALFAAAGAHAQNATNVELSASCTQALKDVDNNPEVQSCLQPDAFVELWQTSPTESIVGPVNTWLSEICATPACSNDLWPTIVQNITTGCAEDIKSQGFTTEDASTGVQYIQEYYPIVRDIMCLKDSDAFCITKTLNDLQANIGTLSIDNIINSIFTTGIDTSAVPANTTCTNCTKAAYNLLHEKFPEQFDDATIKEAQSVCGADFTNGQTPSGIAQTAATNSGNGGSGDDTDAAVVAGKTLLTSLLTFSAAFMAFA